MPFDFFVGPLACPVCSAVTGDARSEIQTRVRISPRGQALGAGDAVGAALALQYAGYFLIRPPEPGGPIRLLHDWVCATCGTHPNWAEVVLRGGVIEAVRAVPLDLEALGRANYITNDVSSAFPLDGEADDVVLAELARIVAANGGGAG